ncbi:PPE family protein [Mycobacterium riyadhense]|uniref:PPE domain-containing protein n=2 Tax=Mycobacterium riyadhense TaxID=486698 RepID=A0A1X2AUH6_9MYCO|nr:PPE family protein [Mycobacterium riyadhense]ORW55053.1 hypothetical protein AWC22_07770 [Mycobacterium riyadhense]
MASPPEHLVYGHTQRGVHVTPGGFIPPRLHEHKEWIHMSFQVLPPEVTSMQMFTGAGSGPLLAAAGGWDGLAAELSSAAASFESLTSGLAGHAWQGAASAAMTAAAAPHLGWLSAASAHAETAASLARAAAAAFEAAQAATVYPAAIAANRDQLVALVNSNLLGLNTPAIFAAEADYELMWAQDIAAMVGYHGESSAITAALAPIVQPLANLANLPAQAAAAASAPTVTGPQPAVAVEIPTITIPPVSIPNLQLPTLNLLGLGIGSFSIPELNIPQISIGSFSLPPTTISISAQILTIPSFSFPAISIPGITLGGFSTPQLATSPLVLPSVQIPASGFWIPFGGSNIPGNMGQLTSANPSLNYVSVVLNGVPNIEVNGPGGIFINLDIPSTIFVNFAIEVQGPTATPGIYIGDFDLGTGQFTGNTGFVLPPIEITGFTIPDISIPSWQTPEITLTNPGVTIDIGSIGVSDITFGPVIVPPIDIGQFQIPNIAVGAIDIAGFNTPDPLALTGGSLDLDFFKLIPRIGIEWTNPFSGLINPGPDGPTLGPITTPAVTATIDVPQITIPQISFPPFNLNAISVPPINLAPFSLGQIDVPNIQVNGINIGAINIPSIGIRPQLPSISVDTFTVPAISVSNFSLPTIKIPRIALPEISLYNPANPVNTFGLDLDTFAFIGMQGADINIEPNPFHTQVHFGVPATKIPSLTLVNATDVGSPYSLVIDGTLGTLTLPTFTINPINLELPTGLQLNLSNLAIGNIAFNTFDLPQITVPPIAIGPLTGTTLPQIELGGIQVGAFTSPLIVVPPIHLTQTILPSFTLLPAIPL